MVGIFFPAINFCKDIPLAKPDLETAVENALENNPPTKMAGTGKRLARFQRMNPNRQKTLSFNFH